MNDFHQQKFVRIELFKDLFAISCIYHENGFGYSCVYYFKENCAYLYKTAYTIFVCAQMAFCGKGLKKFMLSAIKFHVSKKSKRLHNFDAEDVTSLLIGSIKKIKPQCLQMSQISCVHLREILHIVFFGTSIFFGVYI